MAALLHVRMGGAPGLEAGLAQPFGGGLGSRRQPCGRAQAAKAAAEATEPSQSPPGRTTEA